MEPSLFLTESLRTSPHGERVTRILAASLEAVEPGGAVRRYMRQKDETLIVDKKPYPLARFRSAYVVGAGKAGLPMTRAAVDVLGETLESGVVVVKEGYGNGTKHVGPVAIVEAGHPLPDQRGVQGTRRIIDLLSPLGENDLVVCLISGGGSALLTQPAGGITLEDMQTLTEELLACGASIQEINTLRKHLDQVKGGQLARHAVPASVVTLILSDVVGNLLEVVASGPTVPDPSTYFEALEVLKRYDILERVPASIRNHLAKGEKGEIPETPKSQDPVFERVQNVLVGSNRQAAEAGLQCAREEGLRAQLLTSAMEGEARQKGRWLGSVAWRIAITDHPLRRPACLIAGGETTVTLRGQGKGGRNQEMALAAVEELAGLSEVAVVTLATDGGDGPTDAAGAVATGETLARARDAGLDPQVFLDRNDSYAFFEVLGDLLLPGPTKTNVNDLAFVFVF